MKTFIVYDANGKIWVTRSGDTEYPETANFTIADIPDGYHVQSVNVETGEVLVGELPKTEEQTRLDALEIQMAATTDYLEMLSLEDVEVQV